jgi:hypothetical protein
MSFAESASKKIGFASDVISIGQIASQVSHGEWKAAAGTALSFAVDKGFTAGCLYLTAGAAAPLCAFGGMAADNATQEIYNRATS